MMSLREERLRQSDLLRAVEAIDDRPPGGEWLVGQVYTASSIPTCSGCIYLVHPVTVGGAETEGGAGSLAVDATRSIPVVVLGTAPAVGDYLIARSAGGRWVSTGNGSALTSGPLQCAPFCSACSVYITEQITITDANGSYVVPSPGATWTWTTGGCIVNTRYVTPVQSVGGNYARCVAPFSGPVQYQIGISFNCTAGTVCIALAEPATQRLNCPPVACGWAASGFIAAAAGVTVPMVCGPTAITASHTFADEFLASDCTVPSLVGTVTVSIPVEAPKHRLCCSPCGIPTANLTLTIGATTTTLTASGSPVQWSDGTHTLTCTGGNAVLTGGGTWTLSLATYSCSPLHLVFTDGATTAFVDE